VPIGQIIHPWTPASPWEIKISGVGRLSINYKPDRFKLPWKAERSLIQGCLGLSFKVLPYPGDALHQVPAAWPSFLNSYNGFVGVEVVALFCIEVGDVTCVDYSGHRTYRVWESPGTEACWKRSRWGIPYPWVCPQPKEWLLSSRPPVEEYFGEETPQSIVEYRVSIELTISMNLIGEITGSGSASWFFYRDSTHTVTMVSEPSGSRGRFPTRNVERESCWDHRRAVVDGEYKPLVFSASLSASYGILKFNLGSINARI